MSGKRNNYRLNSSGKETGGGAKKNLENEEEPKGGERWAEGVYRRNCWYGRKLSS
jgi:hypothetical protein